MLAVLQAGAKDEVDFKSDESSEALHIAAAQGAEEVARVPRGRWRSEPAV